MSKEEMIIKDYVERFAPRIDGEKYLRLYEDQDPNIQKVYAYFHQQFNSLFEFLNQKNAVNKHYNADESRQLIDLIQEFEEFQYEMKQVGHEAVLTTVYREAIKYCNSFLSSSGGSTIPETYVPISIIKYEQILEQTSKAIKVAGRSAAYGLTMIGQGAFSVVQRYKDPFYNRYFAVKQAKKTSTDRELARFKNEYEILSKLNFPYILEVYSYDESKPIPGLKPGAFGLLHAWLTDSVYTDGYVIPSLDPLTLRNSHRPRDCRPKEIPPVQETPGV